VRARIVDVAPEALDDLRILYDRIAESADPDTALGYLERLEAFCQGMSHAAERGHRRDDIRPGLLIIGFERRITIAFSVSDTRVSILRVFYAGRDWERAL
jgi:plasmid stabilization system protein ParE